MKITIICVGKIKEKYYREALAEYVKRLSKYCKTELIEVEDEETPDKAGEKECAIITQKEGDRLLSRLKDTSYVIATAIKGERLDSVAFADRLDTLMTRGISHITFIIGGSLGLSKAVYERADMRISFSDMTFPHQLMRVILTEQIYRAFRIIHGEPYHK